MEFEITILQPDNYIHSLAFAEIMESLAYGFNALGHKVRLTRNHISTTCPTIILGANLLQPQHIAELPRQAIVYNLEQITPSSPWMTPEWIKSLQGRLVWEYSERNMPYWQEHKVHAAHVPIGYAPSLTRIDRTVERDIDVVFYGSVNARRSRVLDTLKSHNLRVAQLSGVYGAQRDAIIARSKIALNIHYYVPNIFEVVRASYLVANSVPVLSERNTNTYVPIEWENMAYWASYDQLPSICQELLNGDILNSQLTDRLRQFQHIKISNILKSAPFP